MSSLQTTPYVRDIVESYVHYRKVAGLKPLGRSHKVYQLLYHAVQRTQAPQPLPLHLPHPSHRIRLGSSFQSRVL